MKKSFWLLEVLPYLCATGSSPDRYTVKFVKVRVFLEAACRGLIFQKSEYEDSALGSTVNNLLMLIYVLLFAHDVQF